VRRNVSMGPGEDHFCRGLAGPCFPLGIRLGDMAEEFAL
jgi:hypothetical protein